MINNAFLAVVGKINLILHLTFIIIVQLTPFFIIVNLSSDISLNKTKKENTGNKT